MMMSLEAVLKRDTPVRESGGYSFEADPPLKGYSIHKYNGSRFALHLYDTDPIDPPDLPADVLEHVEYVKLRHVLIDVNMPQGEYVRDDARGIVLRQTSVGRMDDYHTETVITIKALTIASAFNLHHEILVATAPSKTF